jgi:hypothetical protein
MGITYLTIAVSSKIMLPSVAVEMPCGICAACCWAVACVALALFPLCGYAVARATSDSNANDWRIFNRYMGAQHVV